MTDSPATTFETVPCPICGVDRGETLFSGSDLLHQADETFRLVTCGQCGHIYQNPRPTEAAIGRFYPEDYIAFQGAIEDEPNPLRRIERRYGQSMRCGAVHRAAGKPGRILDIGCATGLFLDGMRRRGWQTVGIEPSEHAAAYARNRLGLEVYDGRLEDVSLPDAHFDAISMWDVLEHVHEPRRVLSEVARLLRPGGLLVLSLPNPDSLEARLLGEHWLGWDLPRHLNLFRPALLRGILARHHMPVEQIRSFTAGHSVLTMSLVQQARAAGANDRVVARILGSLPARLLTKPYYAGPANWFNLSSIMVVFARRNAIDM